MKKGFFVLLMAIAIIACKSDKKNETSIEQETIEDSEVQVEKIDNTFESKLLDLRDVKAQFGNDYKIEKFGVNKINDSIYGFVFKLDPNTTSETVKAYSIGVKCYDVNLKEPLRFSHSPELKNVDGNRYIELTQNLKKITYLDSIEFYNYTRNDWKSSGRISTFKVRDVLFEDKK
jgi:hypothetical protein